MELIEPTHPSKSRICITGTGGFIGGHLLKHFQHKSLYEYDVVAIPHETAREFIFHKDDVIIHAAGLAHGAAKHDDDYASANFELTTKLAGNAKKAEARLFIFLSSVLVLGSKAGVYNNFSLPNPENPYAKSKAMAEMVLENMFANASDTSCLMLRLAMVYGNGCKGNAGTLSKLAEKQIPLPFGGIKAKRSFLHIDKLIEIIESALTEKGANCRTIYAKDDEDKTIAELYNIMCGGRKTFWFPAFLISLAGLLPFLSPIRKLNQEYRFINSP